jgi:hypothetical protein
MFCVQAAKACGASVPDDPIAAGATPVGYRILGQMFHTIHVSINFCNKWSHYSHLLPVKARLNSMFRCASAKTLATEMFLCRIVLNKDGYFTDKGLSPNHVSSQNLTLSPFPIIYVHLEKIFFYFHDSLPKGRVRWLRSNLWEILSMQVLIC